MVGFLQHHFKKSIMKTGSLIISVVMLVTIIFLAGWFAKDCQGGFYREKSSIEEEIR